MKFKIENKMTETNKTKKKASKEESNGAENSNVKMAMLKEEKKTPERNMVKLTKFDEDDQSAMKKKARPSGEAQSKKAPSKLKQQNVRDVIANYTSRESAVKAILLSCRDAQIEEVECQARSAVEEKEAGKSEEKDAGMSEEITKSKRDHSRSENMKVKKKKSGEEHNRAENRKVKTKHIEGEKISEMNTLRIQNSEEEEEKAMKKRKVKSSVGTQSKKTHAHSKQQKYHNEVTNFTSCDLQVDEEDQERSKVENGSVKKMNARPKKKMKREVDVVGDEDGAAYRFPMSRIRRIIKGEYHDLKVAQEVVFLINKATEMFLEQFSTKAHRHLIKDVENGLRYKHLASVVSEHENFDFLTDFVPEMVTAENAIEEIKIAHSKHGYETSN